MKQKLRIMFPAHWFLVEVKDWLHRRDLGGMFVIQLDRGGYMAVD